MDGGAWWAAVHVVAKSWTRLSDFTSTFHFHALEKKMATHSSTLAWRIPGTGEPGGLPSMGSHRVGHDWSDLAAVAVTRRKAWQGSIFFFFFFWRRSRSHRQPGFGDHTSGQGSWLTDLCCVSVLLGLAVGSAVSRYSFLSNYAAEMESLSMDDVLGLPP